MTARLRNILTNNNVATQKKLPYIFVVQDKESAQKKVVIKNDPHEENTDESENEGMQFEQAEVTDNGGLIWTHKRSSEFDYQATEVFLQIRSSEKYKKLFSDKKYGKIKIWAEIAEDMNHAGYFVGEGKDGAERCRQKFSNLEKRFLKYIVYIRSGRQREPPPFYDYMVNLVDPDDRLLKQDSLVDTIRDNLQVELITGTSTDNQPSSSKSNEHNYSEISRENSLFDKSKEQLDVIALLKQQHEEMMNLQKDFLERIDNHLRVQNEQREKMLNSFMDAMKDNNCECQNRKRKRSTNENIT